MQVKVRQNGQNHGQRIEHLLITCIYSKQLSSKKCNKMSDPHVLCAWLSIADVHATATTLSVLCMMLHVMAQGSFAGARKCCDKSAALPVQARWRGYLHDGSRCCWPAGTSHAGMQKLSALMSKTCTTEPLPHALPLHVNSHTSERHSSVGCVRLQAT